MANIRFPIDCPPDCPHFKSWDMTVDDYTNYCDQLQMQIDDYDCGFTAFLPFCPLGKEKEKKK